MAFLTMKYLNIGCGTVTHPDWINLDIDAASPDVQVHDIRQGLPYSDGTIDICYTSHVIEHLPPINARTLLLDCFRVLHSGGIVRVVVPDLEAIVLHYLQFLQEVESGNSAAIPNYDWMMLELYDQTVRNSTGGAMGAYLSNPNLPNKDFILSRIGAEAENFWNKEALKKQRSQWKVNQSKPLSWWVEKARKKLARILVELVAGKQAQQAFAEGLFRQSGEIHQWMYDRSSLRRLLEEVGFIEVKRCQATESQIPDFDRYQLDWVEGRVRKPDSLFMEGIKP